jgi:hypothetical protein
MAATRRPHLCDLTNVRMDEAIQPRVTLDAAALDEYAAAMVAGMTFPPIVVFFDGTTHWTADGFHRVHAAQRAGLKTLMAEIHQGTRREAMLYAVGANQAHGVRRTNADKRKAVLTLLNDGQWRRWSDREIAKRCGVHHGLVGELRSSLAVPPVIGNGHRAYTTKHGTIAIMDTEAIGKQGTDLLIAPPRPRLAVHFSSETLEHYTPAAFLELVNAVFGDIPDLDPCSNSTDAPNVPAHRHYTAGDDGLRQPWDGRVFLNPPYGREITAQWTEKIRYEWARGEVSELIALLPARTDTEWFDTLTADTDDAVICLLRGRLTFIGNQDPAPFPSMAIYFGPAHDRFAAVFAPEGSLWQRPSRPLQWFVNHGE